MSLRAKDLLLLDLTVRINLSYLEFSVLFNRIVNNFNTVTHRYLKLSMN